MVSRGQPEVPEVVGTAQAAAEVAINQVEGISVGNVTTEWSDAVSAGDVLSQDPSAGPVPVGTVVDLVVSEGQQDVPTEIKGVVSSVIPLLLLNE